MQRETRVNATGYGSLANSSTGERRLTKSNLSLKNLAKSRLIPPTIEEIRIASLKVLALTLLRQVESLEKQIASENTPELNLQQEVQRFEVAIIRSALAKTGGRQRRAARLLGLKVTTLNTKIKRHKITLEKQSDNETLISPS
jgi:DNA-binding NtrC family response regulator